MKIADTDTDISDRTIKPITEDSLEEATEVLAEAFEDDPIIRYFLSGHTNDYPEKLREVFRYQCLMYIEMTLPIFGTVLNSRITGISCLSVPEKKNRPASLSEADAAFEAAMGPDSFARIKRYMNLSKKHTPAGPYHYLAALGIHPDFQGRGFARILMDRIIKISEEHDASTGVFLETAKLKNVEMYRHFGYNLVAEEKLDGIVDLWYLFRPKKQ